LGARLVAVEVVAVYQRGIRLRSERFGSTSPGYSDTRVGTVGLISGIGSDEGRRYQELLAGEDVGFEIGRNAHRQIHRRTMDDPTISPTAENFQPR